jgi:hypothetical protein
MRKCMWHLIVSDPQWSKPHIGIWLFQTHSDHNRQWHLIVTDPLWSQLHNCIWLLQTQCDHSHIMAFDCFRPTVITAAQLHLILSDLRWSQLHNGIWLFQTHSDHNRTMLFQVGRIDLRLISPDRKQILLHKHLKDVASCIQVLMVWGLWTEIYM